MIAIGVFILVLMVATLVCLMVTHHQRIKKQLLMVATLVCLMVTHHQRIKKQQRIDQLERESAHFRAVAKKARDNRWRSIEDAGSYRCEDVPSRQEDKS